MVRLEKVMTANCEILVHVRAADMRTSDNLVGLISVCETLRAVLMNIDKEAKKSCKQCNQFDLSVGSRNPKSFFS